TDAVDDRVGDAVGAGRERARVRDDSGARRRVRAAVEDDRRADEDELALLRRAVHVEEPRGMTMHVTEERLLAPVRHPHGAPRLEREQARMDLDRGVLAGAERAAHAREDDPHLRLRQPEAWRELVEVLVKPLRGDVERDAPVLTRYGEPGLRTERRLVLHRELVFAFDDDVGLRRGVAVTDADALEDVALTRQLRGRGDVDLADAREGVRAAKRRAVEHALAPEVARVLELSLHFRHGVLARRGLSDDAAYLDASTRARRRERHVGDARFIAI